MSPKATPATEFVIMPVDQLSELVSRAVREAMKTDHGSPLLIDKQTLAQKLGCSAAHVDNLRKRGLPVVHVGEALRFAPQDVLEWLRKTSSQNDTENNG